MLMDHLASSQHIKHGKSLQNTLAEHSVAGVLIYKIQTDKKFIIMYQQLRLFLNDKYGVML